MNAVCFNPQPIVLSGGRVRLEPLHLSHAPDLFDAGQDPDLWKYLPVPVQTRVEETQAWIKQAIDGQEQGTQIPFAIIDLETGRAIGSTRYLDIQRQDRNLEIGWTWLTPRVHGTRVNPECKRLLMEHAFETLGAVRVQLKCDGRNQRSQRAMEKLGCIREGALRRQRLCWDGHYRDTVYYSVLDHEWPQVKLTLDSMIIA